MSKLAIDLLLDAGLITSSGRAIDIAKHSNREISEKLSQYNSARISTFESEISDYAITKKLNALFSTGSTSNTKSTILSSTLVYDSIILDDPLVTSSTEISLDQVLKGLKFFEWAFELINAGFLMVLPLSFYNRPSDKIPLLLSEDAFRSCIPDEIHDFIHENSIIKSVSRSDKGEMLILSESAFQKRRTALHVEFRNDYWKSGVSLYLYQSLEDCEKNEAGELICKQTWDSNGTLEEEQFKYWAYQSVNQAMRSRLSNIYNETYLADRLGHTYITESEFEAKFLAMSGIKESGKKHPSARFLEANKGFISIESPEKIIDLRNRHYHAFERFNYSLLHVAECLSDVSPEEFEKKAKKLFHSEIMPQIDEIRINVGSLYKAGVKGGLVTLSGLAAAIATGSAVPLIPALMLTSVGALTEVYPMIDGARQLKKKPAFIWHKLIKS
ncbi:hypothetical protein [Cellvibrio fibrivorans]|uniref:Uncharacterized protein n=1 Tax=Cellvibrio fibrivorans TaxID=126350 RepID=A0ABU1UTV3_9GAMM|nr:hypothetical protein [Cellvibrio fibrivorans]MDR7088600.1 hypothetical protein [Cellvibrio fibrivorans]